MVAEQACVVTGASMLASTPFDDGSPWTFSDALRRRRLFGRYGTEVPFLPFLPNREVLERFITRPDSRYMGPQFQFGVASAGLVLEQARIDDEEARAETGLFIATRVAERDETIDEALLSPSGSTEDVGERLMLSFRPNMFLAQLPNLLASNLSIAFGLRGTSRTYIGDQMAGANALYEAISNVHRGLSQRALAGGSLNADRESLLRWIDGGRLVETSASLRSVWDDSRSGCILGSSAAFLMLESEQEAKRRSVAGVARLKGYGRVRGPVHQWHSRDLIAAAYRDLSRSGQTAPLIISNACGGPSSREELRFWREQFPASPLVSSADVLGTALEADAPSQVVLGTKLLGKLPTALRELRGSNAALASPVQRVLVVTTGFFGDVAVFGVEATT